MSRELMCVENLDKTFRVPTRQAGLRAAIGSLIRPKYREVHALHDLSFTMQAGEMIGLIGPNGAGKTTALKMLAGLLYPSRGKIVLEGFIPWERKPDFLRHISMVQGNKSQLLWDIPPMDTFRVLGEIYRVPRTELNKTIDELVDMLDMQDLLTRPVRNLSLGERMKCELTAGLLHRPSMLFLDEPTLGLDISIQKRLREFLAAYNRNTQAAVILTSHYMADVQALCSRVILLHKGHMLYDGALQELAEKISPFKLIRIVLNASFSENETLPALPNEVELLECQDHHLTLRVKRQSAAAVTTHLLSTFAVTDLVVEDPPIEAVIDQIYQEEGV